jgi:hypothetical protein
MENSGPTPAEAGGDDLIERANSLLARSGSLSLAEESADAAITLASRVSR